MALPSGYSKIDYIEATGTQYFDTWFQPNQSSRVVLDFAPVGTAFGCLFGARTSSNSGDSKNTFGMWIQNDKAYPHYGDGAYAQKPITIPAETRLTFDMNGATTTINGTSVSFSATTFSAGCNLTLFGMNTSGSVDSRRAVGRLYGAKIYDNGTLVRDFVPCKADGGELGLFDLVQSVFYGNAGTGTFTTGNKHKTLIDGTGYEIKSGRVLIDGTGYSIQKGRTLIDGTGYDISFGTPVGELAVGSSVYIDFNGTRREFIVVNHGNPDPTEYDDSCNGTWLYQKYVYEQEYWGADSSAQSCDYAHSGIHSWLNGNYLNMIDSGIRSLLKTVKVPYQYSSNSGKLWSIANSVYGLETKAFLPSLKELGIAKIQYTSTPVIGARLAYFTEYTEYPYDGDATFVAHTPDGAASNFFTRQIAAESGIHASYFTTAGRFQTLSQSYYGDIVAAGVLPILILPQEDALVDSDFNIIPS